MSDKKQCKRIYYLDVLRAIACIAVIIIHASSVYVKEDIGSANFWVANVLDSLARIAVPLFVMVSGSLMLSEDYRFGKKKLIGHIGKMMVFFVFWSAVYCVIFKVAGQLLSNGRIDVMEDIEYFIVGHFHLWFVYLIIGLYLILPLLRLWVKKDNQKYILYFVGLAMIFTIILPQITSIGANYNNLFVKLDEVIGDKIQLQYVGGYTCYFILGWYLHNYPIKNKNYLYILGAVSTLVTIFGTYILSVSTGTPTQMYDDLGVNVLLPSMAVFVFVKERYYCARYRESRFMKSVSKYSLGIYAVHVLFVAVMYNILDRFGFDVAVINIPVVLLVVFISSILVSFIFSKIPYLKKLV